RAVPPESLEQVVVRRELQVRHDDLPPGVVVAEARRDDPLRHRHVLVHRDRVLLDVQDRGEQVAGLPADLPPPFVPGAHPPRRPGVGEVLQVLRRLPRHRPQRVAHQVRARLHDRELAAPVLYVNVDVYVRHILSAFSWRIFRFASSVSGSDRKASTFARIDLIPGLGQSVPQTVFPEISSRRGKYSRSFDGGIPEISRWTFGWRRTRKNAASIHSGRPPCATRIVSFGKSIATSSTSIGSPRRLRAPGNTDVPVWIVTGMPASCATRYRSASPGSES